MKIFSFKGTVAAASRQAENHTAVRRHRLPLTLVALLLAGSALLSSCFTKYYDEAEKHNECVMGDGNVITREISISDYDILIADRNVEVHYRQSDAAPYLKITADSNIIAAMNPRVHKGRLVLAPVWPIANMEHNISMVPTRCVVETNSRHLRGIGSNVADWGALSYRLRTQDTMHRNVKYLFTDFNHSADTSACYGAELSVQKQKDAHGKTHVTADITYMRMPLDARMGGYEVSYFNSIDNWYEDDIIEMDSSFVDDEGDEPFDLEHIEDELED